MSEAGPRIARDAVIVVVNMVDPVRSAIRKAHWLFPESHANDASLRVKWLKYPEWEIYLDEQCSYSSQKHFLRALIRGAYQYIHCEREWLSSMELLGEVSEVKYEFEIVSRRDVYENLGYEPIEPDERDMSNPRTPIVGLSDDY
ncbi:hypothetical protein APSETT444_001643 [Aspergillus pseudonomiae]